LSRVLAPLVVVCALIVCGFSQTGLTAAESDDPVKAGLLKKGYIAVPMIRGSAGRGAGYYKVPCEVDGKKFFMHVDTGAGAPIIHSKLAKLLGLEGDEEVTATTIAGTTRGECVGVLGLKVGKFDTRLTCPGHEFISADLADMGKSEGKDQPRVYDAVLGHSLLDVYDAVIDYPGATLYLRHPIRGVWPKIEGEWVANRVQENGVERSGDDLSVFSFHDDILTLTESATKRSYALRILPKDEEIYAVALFAKHEDLQKNTKVESAMRLRVGKDKLELCIAFDLSKAKNWVGEFAAPKDSGLIALELVRKKK